MSKALVAFAALLCLGQTNSYVIIVPQRQYTAEELARMEFLLVFSGGPRWMSGASFSGYHFMDTDGQDQEVPDFDNSGWLWDFAFSGYALEPLNANLKLGVQVEVGSWTTHKHQSYDGLRIEELIYIKAGVALQPNEWLLFSTGPRIGLIYLDWNRAVEIRQPYYYDTCYRHKDAVQQSISWYLDTSLLIPIGGNWKLVGTVSTSYDLFTYKLKAPPKTEVEEILRIDGSSNSLHNESLLSITPVEAHLGRRLSFKFGVGIAYHKPPRIAS